MELDAVDGIVAVAQGHDATVGTLGRHFQAGRESLTCHGPRMVAAHKRRGRHAGEEFVLSHYVHRRLDAVEHFGQVDQRGTPSLAKHHS